MCYHKSFAKKESDLLAHYEASFQSVTDELELIEEKFSTLMQRDEKLGSLTLTNPDEINSLLTLYSQKNSLPSFYSKQDLSELKWCFKTLSSYDDGRYVY
jgi:hypothetical protein